MARVIEMHSRPLIYSIPLAQAVYCENCVTISNSRPDRCGVCGSEAVVRVERFSTGHRILLWRRCRGFGSSN